MEYKERERERDLNKLVTIEGDLLLPSGAFFSSSICGVTCAWQDSSSSANRTDLCVGNGGFLFPVFEQSFGDSATLISLPLFFENCQKVQTAADSNTIEPRINKRLLIGTELRPRAILE